MTELYTKITSLKNTNKRKLKHTQEKTINQFNKHNPDSQIFKQVSTKGHFTKVVKEFINIGDQSNTHTYIHILVAEGQ